MHQGIGLPYGCRNGACGACKGVLRSGELEYGEHQERALHASEKAAGKALTCCTKPLADIVFEVRELAGAKDLAIRTLPCRVEKVERPAEDVAILYLKLPAGERLQFLAGQYIDMLMKDGKRRSFSMANAPHDDAFLQLHVRKTPGGTFSKYVFEEMKERAILRFEGPLGTFFLREDPTTIFVPGHGVRPVTRRRHEFHTGRRRCAVRGARSQRTLHARDAGWAERPPKFTTPRASPRAAGDRWKGAGFSTMPLRDDFPAFMATRSRVRRAAMTASRADLVGGGLPETNLLRRVQAVGGPKRASSR